ncbi:hypothetical protein VOLCADRAFT_87429 [Volvox carteri f. nagariensis]|uniref:Protein kinase domain-containing protein n=1 Tax=Volvox carteri f. nagariensis TaxID=3068 RepID=D8TLB5_VOLCA|nr:uncharacterized protein VOLCADRAFT_87429 [Volvox carteri f. nagariensis]EFJ51707.1 hypothetical protein VOLCADRAFT_87429 [Volvox carteri f. nagariensis]|eukprot:XP_002947117.1 hypothetical protein VOLCADRAFT_87429 [Volvox carteri f. nagariensis]
MGVEYSPDDHKAKLGHLKMDRQNFRHFLKNATLMLAFSILQAGANSPRPWEHFWGFNAPTWHDAQPPNPCYEYYRTTSILECSQHISEALPVVVRNCILDTGQNSGVLILQRHNNNSFSYRKTNEQEQDQPQLGAAIYMLRVVGPDGVWLLEPTYCQPDLACATYSFIAPGRYSVEVLMVYTSFSFSNPGAATPVTAPWVGYLTFELAETAKVTYGRSIPSLRLISWTTTPDYSVVQHIDGHSAAGTRIALQLHQRKRKKGDSDGDSRPMLPLCGGTGRHPGRWRFGTWPTPDAAPLLRTCIWGNSVPPQDNCNSTARLALRAQPRPATLYWQPYGCLMADVAGLLDAAASGTLPVMTPPLLPAGSLITQERCFPPSRHVCFVGDSHMRYLHNSLVMWLSNFTVTIDNKVKDILESNCTTHFTVTWGTDWPRSPSPGQNPVLTRNCTDVVANVGHWAASHQAGTAPHSAATYVSSVMNVRRRLLALQRSMEKRGRSVRLFWVTSSLPSLRTHLELAGRDWRTEPYMLLYNRLALDVMRGKLKMDTDGATNVGEERAGGGRDSDYSDGEEYGSGSRNQEVQPIPVIDTWSPSRILSDTTRDGTHFENTGPLCRHWNAAPGFTGPVVVNRRRGILKAASDIARSGTSRRDKLRRLPRSRKPIGLSAILAAAKTGVLENRTYVVSPPGFVNVTSDLSISGSNSPFNGGATIVDLSGVPQVNLTRPITVFNGASLRLSNLTLRVAPLPSPYDRQISMLQHVIKLVDGGRASLDNVLIESYNCSYLQDFMRTLCTLTGWKYNTTELQVLNGVVLYGKAGMVLRESAPGSDAEMEVMTTLTNCRLTCPGGLPPPWTCSATYTNGSKDFQTKIQQLLPNTAEILLLSLASNVTLDPATWQPVNLGNVVMGLFGNEVGRTTWLDFGGIAGAFVVPVYNRKSNAVWIEWLGLLGLPYSPTFESPLDFLGMWMHAIRVNRTVPAGRGSSSRVFQLYCDYCTIVVSDDEYNWLMANLPSARFTTPMDKPWLVSLFKTPVLGDFADNVMPSISYLDDAEQVVRIARSYLSKYSVSKAAVSSLVGKWPLGAAEPAAIRSTFPLGQFWVANSSELGPIMSVANYSKVIARSDGRGRPFLSAMIEDPLAVGEFGRQFVPRSSSIRIMGPPFEQTGQLAFWDMQGVTGELFVPDASQLTIERLVLYNLAPGGAPPYGRGFTSGDSLQRRLAYGTGWQPTASDGTATQLPPLGVAAAMANLTLPLWYFAKPFRYRPAGDRGGRGGGNMGADSLATSGAMRISLSKCLLVVPRPELDLLRELLGQAGKLPATPGVPAGQNSTSHMAVGISSSSSSSSSRRRLATELSSPPQAAAMMPGRAYEQLQEFVRSSEPRVIALSNSNTGQYFPPRMRFPLLTCEVVWYTGDTVFFASLVFWRVSGAQVAVTYRLPEAAPTPALFYDVTYDPDSYPPPSPPLPPSPRAQRPPLPVTTLPPTPLLSSPLQPAPSPPAAPTANPVNVNSGLQLAASQPPGGPSRSGTSVVGIAVGVSVGVSAAAAALVGLILLARRRRRERFHSESKQGLFYGGERDNECRDPWSDSRDHSLDNEDGPAAPAAAASSAHRHERRSQGGINAANVRAGQGKGLPESGTTTASPGVSSGTPATGEAPPDSHKQGLARLQAQAAAAPTPADTMAVLAAAATAVSSSRSGTYFSANSGPGGDPVGAGGAGGPPMPFTALPQIQLVVVEDEKLSGASDVTSTGDAPCHQEGTQQVTEAAEALGALKDCGSTRSPASWANPRGLGPVTEPTAASSSCTSLKLGAKSLLQTMDIELALQAYSSRSQVHETEAANSAGNVPQQGSAPAQARSGSDLASAISSLQAELSGRQEQLRITTVLGKGSFGVVYLGTWRGLRVAVKTLVVHDALLGVEGRRRQRAILEAAISTSLQHPNVVSTYAFEVKPLGVVATPHTAQSKGQGGGGQAQPAAAHGTSAAPGERSVWESGGDVYKLYIIQEYCDVGTLRDALSEVLTLCPGQGAAVFNVSGAGVVGSVMSGGAAALCALTLALDVACGMCHIHAKNIVHGDLSSANILLTSLKGAAILGGGHDGQVGGPNDMFGNLASAMMMGRTQGARNLAAQVSRLRGLWRPPVVAKVADFGLSVRMGEGQTHASNKFQGTPLYSAPEVLARGHLTKAADVFSYGVVLLEFFYGMSIAEVKARRTAEPSDAAATASIAGGRFGVAIPASAPRHLRYLMLACISGEPGLRPTFEQVVDSLVDLLLGQHVELQQMEVARSCHLFCIYLLLHLSADSRRVFRVA